MSRDRYKTMVQFNGLEDTFISSHHHDDFLSRRVPDDARNRDIYPLNNIMISFMEGYIQFWDVYSVIRGGRDFYSFI